MILSRSTDTDLTDDEVHVGLLEHGLFGEKVPPCFTSKGLIAAIGSSLDSLLSMAEKELKKALNKRTHDFIRYSVLRDINVPRHFGIPHPESYAVQSLFIKCHWKEIKTHYSKPSQQVSRVHVRRLGGGRIFVMNYRGINRFQLEEDEIRWAAGSTHLVKADISACFPSIYTHSIPWALHGRHESKRKRKIDQLIGNILDKTSQGLRDGQTNGLLIGPHSSNIISEIILTSIDDRLLNCGYKKLKRYIDDYQFHADSFDEAERFIHELGMSLREFELSINEKKTCIISLPQQIGEVWVREITRFKFPENEEVTFSVIRSFLDLALELSEMAHTSAPLYYAIKMLPEKLNPRAKRLVVQEVINLALLFPYLAPVVGPHVFEKCGHAGMDKAISDFIRKLIRLGLKKLYPDAIAHGFYYAMKYDIELDIEDAEFSQLVSLDDCIVNVLIWEYANKYRLAKIKDQLTKKANALKANTTESREVDRQWLLVYQLWSEKELRDKGQQFLADLKKKDFRFIAADAFLKIASPSVSDAASYTL